MSPSIIASGCTAQNTWEQSEKLTAVAVAVMEYNNGYVASNLYEKLGLTYSPLLDKVLKIKDKQMPKILAKKMRNKRLQRELQYSSGNF